MAPGCVFCQIIAGEEPATVVEDWPDTLIFMPRNPVVPGHVLVVPKAHVISATVDHVVTGRTFERAAQYAAARGPCNLITSAGAAATQTVFHLHVHYVPRRRDDGLTLPWTGQE